MNKWTGANATNGIAIVGIGCRFPSGIDDPDALWRLLCSGGNVVRDIPADRWNRRAFYDPDPDKPGKTNVARGAFLEGIDQMDAPFFGISPREAAGVDPQHRLLLETTWEALEDAGLVPERLAGTTTGVFIGISRSDYEGIALADPDLIHPYTNLGVAFSIAANRISYVLDLRGPSMAVDTACASALTAVHLACQSLRQGECTLALAGGSNIIVRPHYTIGFTKAHMLAPDGRCKPFDAQADGFGRAEGVGVVVLKPLPAALADGDPIYAVIRGSGVNTDGRKAGMTLPSAEGQAALLREVYRRARISPARVAYVEAHGTGTPVGDPIEVEAIGRVVGAGRGPDARCAIGSVKANVGHLSSAAGIAGVIKAALCLKHKQVPPQPLVSMLNPNIPFDRLGLRVPRTLEAFPASSEPRIVGVSSFGFGGANAHVVLEEAPPPSAPPRCETRAAVATDEATGGRPLAVLLPFSARGPEALRAFAERCRDYLAEGSPAEVTVHDVGYSLGVRRSHHDYRLTVVAHSREEAREHLAAFLAGESRPGLSSGESTPGDRPRVVFVCSGMGPQWWGMGRELLAQEPVFRDAVARCDALFQRRAGWSLLAELTADESRSRMADTEVAQPANFVLQVGLAALWRAWGLEPDALVGHSAGEVAAVHLAGALSLEDAVSVVYHRSRLQQRTAGMGGMLAVGLSRADAERLIAGEAGRISIAAVNSPRAVTLSGETEALERVARAVAADGGFCRVLKVAVPYHSRYLDPLREELETALRDLRPGRAALPLFSTVTGGRADGSELDARYWWRNLREPVYFGASMEAMIAEGYRIFVELGPHPVLAASIAECLAARDERGVALPSLRRQDEERATMLGTLGAIYALGHPVEWDRLYPPPARFVPFPHYPWQRQRHWLEPESSQRERLGHDDHPLLGRRALAAVPTWETRVDPRRVPFLNDHCVQGVPVYPGAGYAEMGLAACRALWDSAPHVVEGLEIHQPMVFPDGCPPLTVQSVCASGGGTFEVYSRAADGTWVLHATARLVAPPRRSGRIPERVVLDEVRRRCSREVSMSALLAEKERVGQRLGERFQALRRLWIGDGEALGRIEPCEAVRADLREYLVHPAILDACFQMMPGMILGDGDDASRGLHLTVRIRRLCWCRHPGSSLWAHARITHKGARSRASDLTVCDEDGNVVLVIDGLESQYLEGTAPRDRRADWLYETRWQVAPLAGGAPARTAEDLPDPSQVVERISGGDPAVPASLSERDRFEPHAERLATAYVSRALHELGWRWRAGDRISLSEAAGALAVAPERGRFLHRCLTMLCEDGVLDAGGDATWMVRRAPERPEADVLREQWQALLRECPGRYAELRWLRICGEGLTALLRGEIDTPRLLFPEGELATAEWFYQDSPTCRARNRRVQQAVCAAVDALPVWRTVRILEVGAGPGGTAAHVLPNLPAGRVEYVLTDPSATVLAYAEQRFGDYPFAEFRVLDCERDPVDQHFAPHTFDLVVVSGLLRGARDLARALRSIRRLLVSRGLVVFAEPFVGPPRRWQDVIFGGLPGHWHLADAGVRADGPLGSSSGVGPLLEDAGFTDVCRDPDAAGPDTARTVVLARGPRVEPPDVSVAPAELPGDERHWLIFADHRGVAARVADRLGGRGAACVLVHAGDSFARLAPDRFRMRPDSEDDLRRVIAAVQAEQSAAGHVLHLWSLDIPAAEGQSSEAMAQTQTLGALSVLHLVRTLSEARWAPRLWLVTGGAQLEPRAVAQAPLWGLGRVVQNEHPELRCTLVDLSGEATEVEVRALCDEIASGSPEREVALRGGTRCVPRVRRVTAVRARTTRVAAGPGARNFHLTIGTPGVLESLRLEAAPRHAPGPGEVEIEVFAVGLNFKDALVAMAVIRAERPVVGLECAGRISAVGEGVEGLRVGDEVVGLAPGCLGAFVTASAELVVPKPPTLTFAEAATLPIAFLTASYGLEHLGRLAAGERVLVHTATGGVGLAAIQVARRRGAEVLATAGNPEKRELLRALGIEHVMDSRSLSWGDEVMRATGGQGIDVVLNSLAGDAISTGLEALRPYGRFVEIGKTDILADHALRLGAFEKNLSYAALDLSRMRVERPAIVGRLLRDVMRRVEAGEFHPLPHRVVPISNAAHALRHLAKGRHVGKLVIEIKTREPLLVWDASPASFRPDVTYLITGGLGGFGLATAEWMVARGARHLALMGRRGAVSAAARAAVDRLREAGVTIRVLKADVTREDQCAAALAEIAGALPPLRGIVHAAMVLDDGALLRLDAERFVRALWPKMLGAWNLHRLTARIPLEVCWFFSSASAVHGNPGQGNYAAGNAFLDALAQYRRARGLPAVAVNWGAVGDVGYLAEHEDVGRLVARSGVRAIAARDALEALASALPGGPAQIGVFERDWTRVRRALPVAATPRFAEIAADAPAGAASGQEPSSDSSSLRSQALAARPDERCGLLESHLRLKMAKILGLPAANVDVAQPLTALGLDSLMAIELRTWVQVQLGRNVPMMALLGGASLAQLAADLAQRLETPAGGADAAGDARVDLEEIRI
jgi:acyl transferase domain-containing protein/NADPH:quinone reductase-like Zn-dependent oxidoreductase/SAM-dependent methyltransferase/acyl carrier protein